MKTTPTGVLSIANADKQTVIQIAIDIKYTSYYFEPNNVRLSTSVTICGLVFTATDPFISIKLPAVTPSIRHFV